jgi:predicted alpha/beta hydrolase
LGVQARLYRRLAQGLARAGITSVLMEQRGHGRSALRPSRDCDWGFREWLQADIPAALDWMLQQHAGLPLYLGGHSLGGHMSLMARGLYPEKVAGVVLLTTATPWYRCYRGAARVQVLLLISIIPALCAGLGYYPGNLVGFGGREARRLMADWLVMARRNRYSARGIDLDLEAMVQADACPVLSLYCDADNFGPLAAVKGVNDRLGKHEVTLFEITSDALGEKATHISWARQPAITVDVVADWIDRHG